MKRQDIPFYAWITSLVLLATGFFLFLVPPAAYNLYLKLTSELSLIEKAGWIGLAMVAAGVILFLISSVYIALFDE